MLRMGFIVGRERVQSDFELNSPTAPRASVLSGKEAILRFDICLIYGVQWC